MSVVDRTREKKEYLVGVISARMLSECDYDLAE